MTTVSPGWYDDGHGGMRWWDGTKWTEHVAPSETVETPPSVPVRVDSPYWGGESSVTEASPQSGYSPGSPVAAEASTPAARTRKSRLWIVWVGLGAVVSGAVLAGLFGVPLFTALPSTSGDSAGETPNEIITVEPAPVLELTVDEQAAVDAVERYNDAWLTGDCDAYFATTTETYRKELDIIDCDSFVASSDEFATSFDDYATTAQAVDTAGSRIMVHTAETYMSRFDADGNMTEAPVAYSDLYKYDMVDFEGAWAIYTVYLE